MRELLPPSLLSLAERCPFPLYVVGGSVRDYLAGNFRNGSADWDICAAAAEDELIAAARACGMRERAVYRRTGTVKLTDAAGEGFEFSRFRTDEYARGAHAPTHVRFTADIGEDAKRRDFRANAVYYEIGADAFRDPLGGIGDIRARTLRTVAPAKKVFGEDGLRLMRLSRIAAQTGFSPDAECLEGARENAPLIDDIVPERIFAELSLLLAADERADADAPYRGLCLLRDTLVLSRILPELGAGDGMPQRADFHKYDVLEHSFRCVRYAPNGIRFAALLHDVGKPFCMKRDGNFHAHAAEGARLAEEILTRLKAPKKLIAETAALVGLHMRDFDLRMRPLKVRREIVAHFSLLPKLYALRQADFSACRDDPSPAPSVVKWKQIEAEMRAERVPFRLSELDVSAAQLQEAGVPVAETAHALRELLDYCVCDGARNRCDRLLSHVKTLYRPS